MRTTLLFCVLVSALACCAPTPPPRGAPSGMAALDAQLREIIERHTADSVEVAVALMDVATGDSLLIEAHTPMHAASTMKVPVMMQLFRLAGAGALALEDSIPIRNEFRSIADGTPYTLSPQDDSDPELYDRVGERLPIRELTERMIARSSNLATNLLIDIAEPARIETTLRGLGASEMRVLRGVEDGPAFQAGLNNTTTAYGLMKSLEAIARGQAAPPTETAEMIEILGRQEFREMIPAGLPPGTRVVNKTGWITGIHHDGAIVFPEDRAPYVLVVLTRGFREAPAAEAVAREISARVYQVLTGS